MFNVALALGYEVADIEQAGYCGLVLAAHRFDPAKASNKSDVNKAFATFCGWYIFMGLSNLVQKATRISARPTSESRLYSLNHLIVDGKGDTTELIDTLSKSDPDQAAADERAEILRDAFKSLHGRQAEVLKLRFGMGGPPQSLQEIADMLRISKERVRQIELEAKDRLHKAILDKGYRPESLVAA